MANTISQSQAKMVYDAMCAIGESSGKRTTVDVGGSDVTRFADGSILLVDVHESRFTHESLDSFAAAYNLK